MANMERNNKNTAVTIKTQQYCVVKYKIAKIKDFLKDIKYYNHRYLLAIINIIILLIKILDIVFSCFPFLCSMSLCKNVLRLKYDLNDDNNTNHRYYYLTVD